MILMSILLSSLVLATSASATISPSYCDYSLRGGGSLAPDNDIRQMWDVLQSKGWNIIASAPYGSWYIISDSQGEQTSNYWRFTTSSFQYIYGYVLCWRFPGQAYHDGYEHSYPFN